LDRARGEVHPKRIDVLAFGIGVDIVGHLDAAKAVAHVAVDAEDAWMSMSPSIVAVTERSYAGIFSDNRDVMTPVLRPMVRRPPKKRACSILQQRSMTTSRPAPRAILAPSSLITPSWSHRTLALIFTAWRAMSGASAEGRKTSTISTGRSISSRRAKTRSPRIV